MAIETEFGNIRSIKAFAGAIASYPIEKKRITDLRIKDYPYNAYPEDLYGKIVEVVKKAETGREISVYKLKDESGVSKRDVLYFYSAFSDQSEILPPEGLVLRDSALKVGERIISESRDSGRSVTIPQQLEIALEVCGGNLTDSLVSLALISRQMARGCDGKILGELQGNIAQKMVEWKRSVSAFGFQDSDDPQESDDKQDSDDTAGDNYHFWTAVIAGFSVEEGLISVDRIERYKAMFGKYLYENVDKFTNIIRYKVMGRTGETHEAIDRLGFETGRAIFMDFYGNSDNEIKGLGNGMGLVMQN